MIFHKKKDILSKIKIIKTQIYTLFAIIRGLSDKITDTPLLYMH